MISMDTLFESISQRFDSFDQKMEKKIDKIEEKIDDLCDRTGKNTKKIDEHLAVISALEIKEIKKKDNRDRKFYIIIAVMGVAFSAVTLLKG